MKTELQEFFSLVGKAKKEKNDEFKSLVGEINIDSLFVQVKESVKEEKKKKEKKEKQIERQAKALESWLYSELPKKENIEVNIEQKIEEETLIELKESNLVQINNVIEYEQDTEKIPVIEEYELVEEIIKEDDTIDNALKILEQIKTKKEVQENISDPEIIKIRRELEYLKNIVNAQGGGGEVRLEFLDDIDRDSAKTNNYYLKYDSLLDKWIGDPGSGGAEPQNLNQTLGPVNISNIGIVTATSLSLDAGTIISGIITTTTTSETAISSIDATIFRSSTYQIQITQGTNYNMTTINVIHDGSSAYMSEYGIINQPVGIATFSTDINSGFLRLLAYPNSLSTTTFKVILTAIKL
jgi:hypothetical protein